jgi:hypothetical protein
MGAEVFASPFTLLLALTIVFAVSGVHYGPTKPAPILSPRRLTIGYVGVAVAAAAVAGASAYMPIDEAVLIWRIPAQDYWSALMRSYALHLVLTLSVSLIGVACVGVPIVFALGRKGWATAPAVLLLSVPVSTLVAVAMSAGDYIPFMHLRHTWSILVAQHLALALGFCVAAGLPWRRTSK